MLAEESSLFSFYGEAIHEQNELRSSEKPRRGDFANELSVCVCTKPSAKQTIEHRRCGFASLRYKKGTFPEEECSFFLCYGEAIHEQNELRSSEKPRRGDFANELSVCVCTKPSAKQTIEHRRCGFASLRYKKGNIPSKLACRGKFPFFFLWRSHT